MSWHEKTMAPLWGFRLVLGSHPFLQAVQRCITFGGRTLIARCPSRTEKLRWVMQIIVKFTFDFRRVSFKKIDLDIVWQEMWEHFVTKSIFDATLLQWFHFARICLSVSWSWNCGGKNVKPIARPGCQLPVPHPCAAWFNTANHRKAESFQVCCTSKLDHERWEPSISSIVQTKDEPANQKHILHIFLYQAQNRSSHRLINDNLCTSFVHICNLFTYIDAHYFLHYAYVLTTCGQRRNTGMFEPQFCVKLWDWLLFRNRSLLLYRELHSCCIGRWRSSPWDRGRGSHSWREGSG